MGTVASLTSQLSNIGGCTPARDCCGDIDALKGELIRQSQRMAALESGSSTAQTALDKATQALNAINPLEQKAARALDLGESNLTEIGLLAIAVQGAVYAASEAGKLAGQAFSAIGDLGNEVGRALAAMFSGDGEARSLAQRALDLAGAALRSAASADTKATGAATAAATAQSTADGASNKADRAISTADGASSKADRAISAADGASNKADRAISAADGASSKADRASSAAASASSKADRAISAASSASNKADRAISAAASASSKADRASSAAGAASSKADRASSAAGAAQSTADRAITATGTLSGQISGVRSTATNAKATADRAIAMAQNAASKTGAAGQAGRDGINGKDGKDGKNGKDATGAVTAPAVTALTTRIGALENRVGSITINPNIVNPGKEAEIISLIQAMPATLAASQPLRTAITSAAAVGSCQSSRPGGCPGGTPDRFNNIDTKLNGIGAAFGALNNAVLGTVTSTLNVINTKLGSQITGGLSAWSASIAEVVNRSQILNILTYISVLHNAYFLSNSRLSRTYGDKFGLFKEV